MRRYRSSSSAYSTLPFRSRTWTVCLPLFDQIRDGLRAILSEPIDAGTEQEMRSGVVRCAEQFVNVAFPIADVDTSLRRIELSCRSLQIVQPAVVPLNFWRVQNATAASPSGKPSGVTTRLECIMIPHTV